MANLFARILTSVTLISGIFWCLKQLFKLLQNAQQRQDLFAAIGNKFFLKTATLGFIETCASVFPVLLLVLVIRSFIFEPFQIPSGSMMPTLLVGDFILVEKFAYDIKDPLTQTTLMKTGQPKRGDVVVFKYPPDPTMNYIKRVVGLPGDRVSYNLSNKHLTVKPGGDSSATALPITYTEVALSNFVQRFKSLGYRKTSNAHGFRQFPPVQPGEVSRHHLVQHQESIDRMSHNILTLTGQQDQLEIYYQQPGQSLAEWLVPPGKYFMMGDNRDNSADSRYWGFVPEKNLVGKATAIWMSFDKQEGKWPTGLRLSRIGFIH